MAKYLFTYKGYKVERADYIEDSRRVKNYNIYGVAGLLLAVRQSQRACRQWINKRLALYA